MKRSLQMQSCKRWHGARFSAEICTEDAIGSHTCSLEASKRAAIGIHLGCPFI
jgi:hypothetical protein